MKRVQRASPFLYVHRTRGHPVLVHHAFGVKVGECIPYLHVRHHGRFMHPETTVRSTSAPTVGEHRQERVLVDGVVPFAQSFGAVLVGGSETIVRLATQPHEPGTDLDLEQTRCPLVEPRFDPPPLRRLVSTARNASLSMVLCRLLSPLVLYLSVAPKQ